MVSALKSGIDELAKNAKQAPGWVPLIVACYIAFDQLGSDQTAALAVHKDFLVGATTLVLYMLGDALDRPVWTRLAPRRVDEARVIATKATGVQKDDGLYRVSKALATAAKKYDGSWIRVKNESAKLVRSGIVPCVVAAFVLLSRGQFGWAVLAVLGAGLLLLAYLQLKASHVCDLYRLVGTMSQDKEKYVVADLPQGVSLFFWDGQPASSARRQAQAV